MMRCLTRKETRKKNDFHETPYSMTQQLLDNESFGRNKTMLEPACGNEAIVTILINNCFRKLKWYDIDHDGSSYFRKDFLTEKNEYDYIITNPPFSLAYEFILQAKKVCIEKFAFLLPLNYLYGKKRYDEIYQDKEFPLARIHIFTRYQMLGEELRSDGKYHTGMMVYAWYVWDRNHKGNPEINWIDNDKYVLRKGE